MTALEHLTLEWYRTGSFMLDAFISYSDFHLKSWIVKIVLVCFVGWSTKNSINSIQQREQQSWADWRGKMIHWTAPGSPVCQCPGQSSHCGSPLCFPARMRDVMMLSSLQCTVVTIPGWLSGTDMTPPGPRRRWARSGCRQSPGRRGRPAPGQGCWPQLKWSGWSSGQAWTRSWKRFLQVFCFVKK